MDNKIINFIFRFGNTVEISEARKPRGAVLAPQKKSCMQLLAEISTVEISTVLPISKFEKFGSRAFQRRLWNFHMTPGCFSH